MRRRQRLVEDEAFVGERDRRLDELGPLHLAAAVLAIEIVEPGDDARNVGRRRARRRRGGRRS